ncbi:citrate synthase [Xylona heveae TC161]|uniref:Citrate synthase n=1 Tax=Xylona heveae (strain CBS 132557 / TC161) TaxID=1328760 RepID=A0A165FGV4_XYLHT|nr:citrate synthase [Xylona heveae TC161]KZF20963.1 citrate synthase [Xylona heveae TC161]
MMAPHQDIADNTTLIGSSISRSIATPSVKEDIATKTTSEIQKPTSDVLHVVDSRTGSYYNIPITNNAITASDLKHITAPAGIYEADQNEKGLRVYDPGFSNTAVMRSEITYIDGLKGIIQYRGYSIDQIVGRKGFYDTLHLLIWGRWPSSEERAKLQVNINSVPLPGKAVFDVIRSFPREGSIMGMIIAGLSALQSTQMNRVPAHEAKTIFLGEPSVIDDEIINFVSRFLVITAVAYTHHSNRRFNNPRPDLSYIENWFYMTNHVDPHTGLPNPRYVDAFERLWVVIADHEMTCSTAALLHTASALPDLISSIISALSAMYGPLHGGAIEVAYKQIEEIGSIERIPLKLSRVKEHKERLYGYGHRVYRVSDPRYVFIKHVLDDLQDEIAQDPLLKVAFELDRIAQEDEYFISRKLKPNADLFAAFAYKAMGFPPEVILPISMLSRAQGFLAHWKEAMSGNVHIWRPSQIYQGKLNLTLVDDGLPS